MTNHKNNRMNKKITLLLSLLFAFLFVKAEPLSPSQALKRLKNQPVNFLGTRSVSNPMLLKTINDVDGNPAVYLFSENDLNGFMVLSADSNVSPLLGFSDQGSVETDNQPPALDFWIEGYARQIGEIRKQSPNSTTINTKAEERAPIAPLVQTKWDQGSPYNKMCPKVGNTATYTGCVATSMAQVMNYFKFPEKGEGTVNYTPESLGKELTMDLSDITFDWANMLDSYAGTYSTTQANAVAQLMVAAGYSVEMDYGTDESGAVSDFIPGALVNYFNYDRSILIYDRNQYASSDWAELLYNNLKNVGPILYSGTSQDGSGHSFVCDGYQGDGYFHFNWGWSGVGDGYYLIDALSPSSIGIGGGSGGFNYFQSAILNIKPEVGTTSTVQREFFIYGSITGKVASSNLTLTQTGSATLGWGYKGLGTVEFYIGAGFVKADDPNATPIYAIANNIGLLELSAGYYYPQSIDFTPVVNLSDLGLETGVKYKVFSAAQRNSKWSEVDAPYGSYNYFYLTKSADNKYEISNLNPLQFTVSGLSFESELYAGNSVKVKASLTNDNDEELTRAVSLVLLNANNSVQFSSDSFVTTLQSGETKEFEWATALVAAKNVNITTDTQLYPALYDLETNTTYYKSATPVIIHPNPGDPDYYFEFIVENAPKKGSYFIVDDPTNFNIVSKVSVKSGYFSYPVTLTIFQVIPNTNTASLILSYPYDIEFINAGETKDLVMNINFPNATEEDIYCIDAFVTVDGESKIVVDPISTFFVLAGNSITTDVAKVYGENADIDFDYDGVSKYLNIRGSKGIKSVNAFTSDGKQVGINLSGTRAYQTAELSALQGEILIVTATDSNGRRKTIKLAL